MPPRSRATGFDRLAPDERAAVELVLRQGRSYGELSELLGMPEETIRTRARSGLAALAPDLPAPVRAGEIADWLLGQQAEAHATRTREFLLSDPDAHRWAATVAAPLREAAGGESVPALPTGSDVPEPRVNGMTKRPQRKPKSAPDEDATPHEDATPADDGGAAAATIALGGPGDVVAARGRSSRLGGALLIGAAVLIVGVVLAFVFLRDGEEEPAADTATPAAATATPSAAALQPGDVIMQGPAGSKALAVMRLVQTGDQRVEFALVGQDIPPNTGGERYSLWFRKNDGSEQLLGDVRAPVEANGVLTSSGPAENDVDEFPEWFQTYDTVILTDDEPNAKEPGRVILSGDLPKAAAGG